MREFQSLSPAGLPEAFDAAIHGDEPVITVNEARDRIIVSYAFPGFYFVDDSRDLDGERIEFKGVDISKTGVLAESGKPLLPSFGRYVQIPRGCEYEIQVNTADPIMFQDVLITPAQQKLTDDPNQKHIFEFEKDFYQTDQWYPEQIVKVDGPYDLDQYKALLIHVRPVQYNPALKQLQGYGNVTVTIELSSEKKKKEKGRPVDSSSSREAFGNLFLNPRRGVETRLEVARDPVPPQAEKTGPEFLVIYHDAFTEAVQKLVEWKQTLGLLTEAIPFKDTGGTTAAMKTYIRNRRGEDSSRVRYVLLFGDVDVVPGETITHQGASGQEETIYSDYYYATPRDSTGREDLVMPWLSIGRIPVRTSEEAACVVNQILDYEANPPGDSEYYRRMTFAAYFQDDRKDGKDDRNYMKTLETIRAQMTALGFNVQRVYVTSNPNMKSYRDGTPVPQDVKNAVVEGPRAVRMLVDATNEGQLIMAHRDHGLELGWHLPHFQIENLEEVTSRTPSLFFSVNCLTGRFDLEGGTECFAEKILLMDGAAPSLVAATRPSHTWLNDALMTALFDGLWGGVIPTFPGATISYPIFYNRLGDILNYAKSYLPISLSGSMDQIIPHVEMYHVVGDPTLRLWREEPRKTSVKAVLLDGNLQVILSDCPAGTVITVWFENQMVKRIEPFSAQFKISLRELTVPYELLDPRTTFVCFSAPGHRFVKRYVEV